MKHLVEFSKWLLEKEIRPKNAASALIALLSLVIFYFTSRHSEWFHELQQGHGAIGVAIAHLLVFLVVFLCTSLIYSRIADHHRQVVRDRAIRDDLDALSDWQRRFLRRFIDEKRRQIPWGEVGFPPVWEPEMNVLLSKGIVTDPSGNGEVYEIEPIYYHYLKEHYHHLKERRCSTD